MSSSGYTAITFVANEQPTTAKWNLIGSNDASFNTGNGFNDGIIVNRHMAANAVGAPNIDPSGLHRCFRILTNAVSQGANWTALQLDTTVSGSVGITVPNPNELQVSRAGLYSAGAIQRFSSGGPVGSWGMRVNIVRAGTVVDGGFGEFTATGGSIMAISGYLDLQANDVVRFYSWNSSAWTPTGVNNTTPAGDPDRAFINKCWLVEHRG